MSYTDKPDYWSLLGLTPNSDSEQLKRAFRREARRWHPDLNGNDQHAEERFKLVNEAYAVLSDPVKRNTWENALNFYRESEDPFSEGFPSFENYLEVVLGIDAKTEEFIEISKAYETNDFIKLFMLCYENKIEIELTKKEIELIEKEIKNKEEEIRKIKEQIHWKWIECANDLEKELLKQYVNNY